MTSLKKTAILTPLLLLFFFLISIAMPQTVSAATAYEKISANTVLDAKYGFSPRFIKGVTTLETFGATSTWEDDCWTTDATTFHDGYQPIRLTSNSQKGKMGGIYRNVGEYKGKPVDMKITITDWQEIRKPEKIDGKMSYPMIAFNGRTLGIAMAGYTVKRPEFKAEFLQDGNLVPLSGHLTFNDLDVMQYVDSDNFTKGYLTSDTKLQIKDNGVGFDPGSNVATSDTRYWVTYVANELYSFHFVFGNGRADTQDFSKPRTNRTNHYMGFGGDSIAPFDTPQPVQTAPKSIYQEDTIRYEISFMVPKQPAAYQYSKFVLTDVLPAGVTYKSFTVTDDSGKTVTKEFFATISGKTFTLKPVDLDDEGFYFRNYTVQIVAKLNPGYDLENEGTVLSDNRVSITSKIGSRPETTEKANPVQTEVLFRINTSTDGNGTITGDVSGISGGSDRQITYSPNPGYKVKEVLVDGKKVTPSGGKYIFSDIYDDHEIYVSFTPTTDNKITLTKRVHRDDVYSPYGTPTAIFRLTGTDLNGESHTYYQAVELSEEALSGDYYTASVIFDNLTAGTYTGAEIETSRYALKEITGVKAGTESGGEVEFDLVNNKAGKATFVNVLENFANTSHSDVIINQF